jgi:hypothetical protein
VVSNAKILLGPHLILGKGSPDTCLRIYLYIDEEMRAFVVGDVGRHLGDTPREQTPAATTAGQHIPA